MAKRRRLTPAERHTIYDKMGGHCAYCGCELKYEDMQVDHVIPLMGWSVQGPDTLENMLPACRSCNHYKSSMTLDRVREMLAQMPHVLARDSVTYKNAVRFGLVTPTPHRVEFFFERLKRYRQKGATHDGD